MIFFYKKYLKLIMKQYNQFNETMNVKSNGNFDFDDEAEFDIIVGKKIPMILNKNTGEIVEIHKKNNLKKLKLSPLAESKPEETKTEEKPEIPIPAFSEIEIDELIWKKTRFSLNFENVLKCDQTEISFNFVSLKQSDKKPDFASMLLKKATIPLDRQAYFSDEYDSDEEYSLEKEIEQPKNFSWKTIEIPIEKIHKIGEKPVPMDQEIDDGFIQAGKKNKKKEKKVTVLKTSNNVVIPKFSFPQLKEKQQIPQQPIKVEIPINQEEDEGFTKVGKKVKKNILPISQPIKESVQPLIKEQKQLEKKMVFKIRNTTLTTEYEINPSKIDYHARPSPEKFKTLCSSVFCTRGITCPFSHNIFTESKISKCFKKPTNPNEKICEPSCKFIHASENLVQYARRLHPAILFDQFGNHFFIPEQLKNYNAKFKTATQGSSNQDSKGLTLENFIQKKQTKK